MWDEDQRLIQNLFNSYSYAEKTRSLYTFILTDYAAFHGMTLTEVLSEAEIEEDKGVKKRFRKIGFRVAEWKANLEEKGRSPHTIRSYLNAIKTFYDFYDITPPRIKTRSGDIGLEQNYGRLLTREDIRKMTDAGDARTRAVIYTLALTGLSQAELRNIKIQQLLDAAGKALGREIRTINDFIDSENDLNHELLTVYITREKVHHRFFSFIPPEATRQIIAYLRERVNNRNEKLHPHVTDGIFRKLNGDPITPFALREVVIRAGELAGFKTSQGGAYAWWRGHALRKYFISTIKNKLGDTELAEWLVGHKPDATSSSYWYKDPEDLKKRYLQALEFLSIDGGRVLGFESKEYKEVMKHLDGVKWVLELLDEDPEFQGDAKRALLRRQENRK